MDVCGNYCNKKHNNQNSKEKYSLGKVKVMNPTLNTKPSPLTVRKPRREGRPRKRALLIAVSYKKQKYELKGTINDVKKMKDWLMFNYDFKLANILILTEEEADEEHLSPTKKNIEIGMKWLMEESKSGDSLVFYFSGHGLRQPDFEGDERDGMDECICPVDFMEAGMILDNQIYSTIVRPLIKGVTLHAIIDACHSGTVLDLPYMYNRETKKWEDNSPPSGAIKQTSGGLAITFGACRDDQMAADTNAFSPADLKMSGALTFTLTRSIEKRGREITYGELLDDIYNEIERADQDGCLLIRLFKKLLNQRLFQPQLCASEPFDVYKKKFAL
ncbi:metacaspase-1-like isoform X2 [Euphorbia lathyris]|uniref:metacaspase-1-like isoform X2 n=1 Tax=Euphorbia lathyris TaxID=212925 RepID=UPI0033131BC7